jgi:hypothetical protein
MDTVVGMMGSISKVNHLESPMAMGMFPVDQEA